MLLYTISALYKAENALLFFSLLVFQFFIFVFTFFSSYLFNFFFSFLFYFFPFHFISFQQHASTVCISSWPWLPLSLSPSRELGDRIAIMCIIIASAFWVTCISSRPESVSGVVLPSIFYLFYSPIVLKLCNLAHI